MKTTISCGFYGNYQRTSFICMIGVRWDGLVGLAKRVIYRQSLKRIRLNRTRPEADSTVVPHHNVDKSAISEGTVKWHPRPRTGYLIRN